MIKTLSLAVVLGVIGAGAAFAQTAVTPPPAAVTATSPDAKGAASPVAGGPIASPSRKLGLASKQTATPTSPDLKKTTSRSGAGKP